MSEGSAAVGPLQHLQIDYATEPTDHQPRLDQPKAFQLFSYRYRAPRIHRYLWRRVRLARISSVFYLMGCLEGWAGTVGSCFGGRSAYACTQKRG